jgi:hypothetical protein
MVSGRSGIRAKPFQILKRMINVIFRRLVFHKTKASSPHLVSQVYYCPNKPRLVEAFGTSDSEYGQILCQHRD